MFLNFYKKNIKNVFLHLLSKSFKHFRPNPSFVIGDDNENDDDDDDDDDIVAYFFGS